MAKKTPKRVAKEKVAFRLASDVVRLVRDASARLDVSQAKVIEVLVRKHADALQIRLE